MAKASSPLPRANARLNEEARPWPTGYPDDGHSRKCEFMFLIFNICLEFLCPKWSIISMLMFDLHIELLGKTLKTMLAFQCLPYPQRYLVIVMNIPTTVVDKKGAAVIMYLLILFASRMSEAAGKA
jgi:hypothetical protein